MARTSTVSLSLHDETTWRLPDWEEFSESGRSAWNEDESDSDAAVRVPRVPPMASTSTLTTSTRRPLLPITDLKALHMRFSQERERATQDESTKTTTAMLETQTQIASQLERVREELRDFQHAWQCTDKEKEHLTIPPVIARQETSDKPLRFDMAVQTDVLSVNEDAMAQWLHLITQKMEVLTTSFHGDTTQLPLRYPLQTDLERPVSFTHEGTRDQNEFVSVASWHVGSSLKTLVSESTAERLLDLERAVACLATATRHTTSRYVEYFEQLVMQIQDLHQQRLRQVVDESLQEMKNQRSRYRKRIELLEAERQAAKDEVVEWQQQGTATRNVSAIDTKRLEAMTTAREVEWEQERQSLEASIERLQRELAERDVAKADGANLVDGLRAQLAQMAKLVEAAQHQADERAADVRDKDEQIRRLQQQHRSEIERLEHIHTQLRAEIVDVQQDAERMQLEATKKHGDELARALERAATDSEQEITRLKQAHARQIEATERTWRVKLQDAEETKRLEPVTTTANQWVQTDPQLLDEGSTDERIARLKKRCKALETLLDKKFEDSSAASVASLESTPSGQWSSRWQTQGGISEDHDASGDVGSRTLPLTMSLESSLDDTFLSSHAANTPSRDHIKTPLPGVWETSSNLSAGSLSQVSSAATGRPTASDPDAPSPAAMLALVRKLEALATSTMLPTSSTVQPDEEPDLSAATTPRKSPATSRPTSASFKKPGWTSNRSSGLAGSFSAPVYSLKDPRRQRQQQSVKIGTASAAQQPSSSSATAKQAPSRKSEKDRSLGVKRR